MATLNMDWFRDLLSSLRRPDRKTFRTTKDAYDFVQRVYRETGGPTPELRATVNKYKAYKKQRDELEKDRARAA